MSEPRIQELEDLLFVANASIVALTATNHELTRNLSEAEVRNRKLRRSARKDASSFKEQLAVALSRRG